jgi:hypothetical protein
MNNMIGLMEIDGVEVVILATRAITTGIMGPSMAIRAIMGTMATMEIFRK